jgi:hypothetical protein
MMFIGKCIASTLVFVATFFFSYWMIFVQIFPIAFATLPALTASIFLTSLAWMHMDLNHLGVFGTTLISAGIVGAVGFVGGFFGPLVFAPGANQGPLLGLFITGPLGFVAGGIGGFLYSLLSRVRA